MRDERKRARLDEDRHRDGLHDDIGSDARDTHAKDRGHDHDEEACEVNVIALYDGQDEVAHIEPHGCQSDGTDDDADDDAAHADRDRTFRPFDDRFQDLGRAHAGILTKPAGADGDKDGDHGRIERGEAGKHQPDEADERKHQMPLLLDDDHRIRDILLCDAGESETFRLKMDRQQKADVVEERRCDGGECHIGVRQIQKFRHDEADRAHDRRGELTACRCHGFDSAGKFLLVARALHERNGDGTGRRDIGDGRAIDHAHETGGDDRHLRRAAGCTADKRQREIIDEFREAAVLQESTEDDEKENIGRRYADTGAEHALRPPELGDEHALQREAIVSEIARQVCAKPVVRQKDCRENRKISRCTARRFKDADDRDEGDADLHIRDTAAGLCNARVIQDQVSERADGAQNENPVPDRRQLPSALLLLIRRKQQKGKQQ